MSTFDGRIKEYPELAIDNFTPNNYSQFFLLSHVHKDHTRGLENEEFNKTLYCSKQTARMLPLMETRASKQLMYAHLKDRLKAIPYYEPTCVKIKSEIIKFTFYPANHCPGASLILIEGDRGTVLYTGDMRAEPDFVRNNLACLRDFRIKNLYMDTTCCYEDRRTFISKSHSVAILVNLVKAYPDNFHLYLDTWTVGYEEMWITIKENFDSKVHVSHQRYNMYVNLEERYKEVLTTDPTLTRFHSCRWDEGCFKHEAHMVSIHPVPNRNIKAFEFKSSKQSRLLQSDLPRHCKPYQQMILPFSTHSSLSEIVFFYKFVRPKKFTPCVAHGGWKTQYLMHALLREEGCIVSDTPSSSEIERGNLTSTCSSNDSSEEPKTVNDDESTACSTINYISTAEESLVKSVHSVTSNSEVHSQPLSEKSTNENEPNNGSASIKRVSSFSKDKTTKASSLFYSEVESSRFSLQENENIEPSTRSSSSLPINLSTQRSKSSHKNNLVLSHASFITSDKSKNDLKLRQTHEDISCLENHSSSVDPDVIVLSVPSTIDHNTTFSSSISPINIQQGQALVESNSGDNEHFSGYSLTSKSTQRFINSFVASRKRQRKNAGRSIDDPITL